MFLLGKKSLSEDDLNCKPSPTQRSILCKCCHIHCVELDVVVGHVELAGGVVPQVQLGGEHEQVYRQTRPHGC